MPVTFQTSAAKPLLQSADMQSVGGGYDSANPAVIRRQVAQFEPLGVDAVISDLTNNVSCIFEQCVVRPEISAVLHVILR
jgi:hypothetical protein